MPPVLKVKRLPQRAALRLEPWGVRHGIYESSLLDQTGWKFGSYQAQTESPDSGLPMQNGAEHKVLSAFGRL